jgi:hypothetical protein
MVIDREIAFIEVPLSAAGSPRALPKAQLGMKNWDGAKIFFLPAA